MSTSLFASDSDQL
uniref:Uncharacterized protein n=1 Tax=Solanum tuberosum TaxID=4113 RepID=Q65ZK7_SOLTU|nr:unknown [Solanum tuberosum]